MQLGWLWFFLSFQSPISCRFDMNASVRHESLSMNRFATWIQKSPCRGWGRRFVCHPQKYNHIYLVKCQFFFSLSFFILFRWDNLTLLNLLTMRTFDFLIIIAHLFHFSAAAIKDCPSPNFDLDCLYLDDTKWACIERQLNLSSYSNKELLLLTYSRFWKT